MQGRNRDADRENRLVETVGEGEIPMNSESITETHTLPYVKEIASGKLPYHTGSSTQSSVTTAGVGWGGQWEGGS